MRYKQRLARLLMIATVMATPLGFAACASHQSYYDPYYHDNHRWDGTEDGFYRRWESETGRSHLDFGRRPSVEQHAYYDWRHAH